MSRPPFEEWFLVRRRFFNVTDASRCFSFSFPSRRSGTEGVRPTKHTYTILIRALGESKRFDRMRQAWQELQARDDVELDSPAYVAILDGLALAKDVEGAEQLFADSRQTGRFVSHPLALCHARAFSFLAFLLIGAISLPD
jgi:pentatricopeptide repeat protein